MSRTEFTPERISRLRKGEIFVFGSNLAGHHGAGAARAAVEHFGAIYGQGVGLQGQSYAIPTMQGGVETIKPYVDEFTGFAKAHPELRFFVTPIGCGIAGFKSSEIAPLFAECLDLNNVILPKSFVDFLTRHLDYSPVAPLTERQAHLVSIFKDTMSMIIEKTPLAESVERSISGTKYYPESGNIAIDKNLGKMTKISVTTHRTFQAAELMTCRNLGKRVAVLNFASATCPGGGVTWGSSAQEECLCRSSTLYPVLNRKNLLEQYYTFHLLREDHLYTDACIYSPDIKVIKSDALHPDRLPENKWFDVDVITCAAPNLRKVEPLQDGELQELHIRRGRKILDVALDNGVECLVLGAFGCGAFRNNPWVVSRAYAQLMKEYKGAFDEVEFAVFCKERDMANYEAFKKALEAFEK